MTTPTHSPEPWHEILLNHSYGPDKELADSIESAFDELSKRQESIDGLKTALGAYGTELARLREQNRRLHESLSELIDHIDHYGGVSKGAVLMCGRARAALAGKGEQQ